MADKYEMVRYRTHGCEIQLRAEPSNQTVWATQQQIADAFGVALNTINEHLKNIFRSGELDEQAVVRKFRIRGRDGKQYNTLHYSLDAILSVGYRVNSVEATAFRRWANKILSAYLLKGAAINEAKFGDVSAQVDRLVELAKESLISGFMEQMRPIVGGISKSVVQAAARDIKKSVISEVRKEGDAQAKRLRTEAKNLEDIAIGHSRTRTPGTEFIQMIDKLVELKVPEKGRGILSRRCVSKCKTFLRKRGMLDKETRRSEDHRKVWLFRKPALDQWLKHEGMNLIKPILKADAPQPPLFH